MLKMSFPHKLLFFASLISVLSFCFLPVLTGSAYAEPPAVIDEFPYAVTGTENKWTSDFTVSKGPVLVQGNLVIDGSEITCEPDNYNNCLPADPLTLTQCRHRSSICLYNENDLSIKNAVIYNKWGNSIWIDGEGKAEISNLTMYGDINTPIGIIANNSDKSDACVLSGTNNFINLTGSLSGKNNIIFKSSHTVFSESGIILHSDLIVESGTLTFDKTVISTDNSSITVKDGATLEFKNGCYLDLGLIRYFPSTIKVEPGGKLIVEDSVIHNGNGDIDDAYITSDQGIIEIRNSKIQNNKNNNSFGHIIHLKGGTTVIMNSELNDNHVGMHDNTIPVGGGAIFAEDNAKINITSSKFESNSAGNGAAIRIEDGALIIDGGTIFTKNKSNNVETGGGAISALRSEVTLFDVKFTSNEAYQYGGAIHQQGGKLILGKQSATVISDSVSGPTFMGNRVVAEGAAPQGGAIVIDSVCEPSASGTCIPAELTIYDALFENNTSTFQGGAISIGSITATPGATNVFAVVHKGQFIDNEAAYNFYSHNDVIGGGAIAIQANGQLSMKKAAIVDNTTNSAGGAIASGISGKVYLYSVNGAAIFSNHADLQKIPNDNNYEDVFILDDSNGSAVIYNEMFNRSSHNWDKKVLKTVRGTDVYNSLLLKSNPANTASLEENAAVIFKGNRSIAISPDLFRGAGGAIGTNGILIIGEEGANPQPTRSQTPEFFRIDVLPRTGFSTNHIISTGNQPLKVEYKPLQMSLELPTLSVSTEIVTVPFIDGQFPVEWIGSNAGLLEGSSLPGEGISVITGHNHLNTMEAGPFALLLTLQEGDRIFIRNRNELKPFIIFANELISADDSHALQTIAEKNNKSLVLLTCENESLDGNYINRRVVAAYPAE